MPLFFRKPKKVDRCEQIVSNSYIKYKKNNCTDKNNEECINDWIVDIESDSMTRFKYREKLNKMVINDTPSCLIEVSEEEKKEIAKKINERNENQTSIKKPRTLKKKTKTRVAFQIPSENNINTNRTKYINTKYNYNYNPFPVFYNKNYPDELLKKIIAVYKIYNNNTIEELLDSSDAKNNFEDISDFDLSLLTGYEVIKSDIEKILGLTIGEYLILACCYKLRFVSAQDRQDRICLTRKTEMAKQQALEEDKILKDINNKGISSRILYIPSYSDISSTGEIIKFTAAFFDDNKPGKLSFESYKNMKPEVKYNKIEDFNKNKAFIEPGPNLKAILYRIMGEEQYENNKISVEQKLNEEFFTTVIASVFGRKIQVMVYDLVQQIAYNELYNNGKIDPAIFNKAFNNFESERAENIGGLINSFVSNNTIMFLQEYNNTYTDYLSSESKLDIETVEKGKKGSASAIFTNVGDRTRIDNNAILEVKPLDKAADWDIVASSLRFNDNVNILLFSIHTPSDGKSSVEIITRCFNYFESNKDNYTNMIIGIDANVKNDDTKSDFIDAVLTNGGRFAYFNTPTNAANNMVKEDSKEAILTAIKEREEIEKTSVGERTFGLQSQFSKAGESIKNYIDFIILAGPNINVVKTEPWTKGMLNANNMSDHAPRQAIITIKGVHSGNAFTNAMTGVSKITLNLVSFNVAGPNSNILEYANNAANKNGVNMNLNTRNNSRNNTRNNSRNNTGNNQFPIIYKPNSIKYDPAGKKERLKKLEEKLEESFKAKYPPRLRAGGRKKRNMKTKKRIVKSHKKRNMKTKKRIVKSHKKRNMKTKKRNMKTKKRYTRKH